MKITRNTRKEIQFEELCRGVVFITVEDNCVCIKTDEAYQYPDDRNHYYNAVSLGDGSLVKIDSRERVLVPQNVTLTFDE